MPSRSRRLAAMAALCLTGMLACESPTGTTPVVGGNASSAAIATQADLGTEIRSLVTSGFPKGQATAILANWDQVLRDVAAQPKTTLKGKTVPGSQGRSSLARTVSYVKLKTSVATPPAGETQAHFVARLVLDMSLYVYGGPSTPPPTLTATSDVAFDVVQPGTTDTVVTTAKLAAVIFPSGGVSEQTIVVITPDSVYYPDNCSGPLDTHLCQYPRFYHFNVFPDVKLATPAKVQVCHVDAGTTRLPLADHDRFRVAHDKPADPADYSAGSTIVDNVEVLALTTMNVTTCTANGGTQYTTAFNASAAPLGRLASFAHALATRVSSAARALFVPKNAYAIDVGGGGFTELFSNFGVVDPQSKPDLAQTTAPATRFTPTAVTALTGSTLGIAGWSVTNLGSGTSGAFTSSVIVASDSQLTAVVATVPVGGAASLIPRSNFGYAGLNVVMPATPGTYFVGTRITPAGADSASDDDWTSVRVVVTAPVVGPADVAIQPGFSVTPLSVVQGSPLSLSAFTVKNLGGTLSPAFNIHMTLATDSLLRNIVTWPALTGPGALAGGASFTYAAAPFNVSRCQAPGTYFIGPRLDPIPFDVDSTNDRTSRRITVLSEPPPTAQSAGSAAWTTAGPGTLSTQVNPHCANLTYSHVPSTLSPETFTFTTTAVTTGPYNFSFHYTGLHSWFMAYAKLEAFADSPAGEVVVTLVPNTSVYDFFSFSGTGSLNLTAGYNWGIRATGVHYDSSRILLGTVQIFEP